ncbi:MAG TPA: proton-conducting transporter membrane subunit [Anaerolineae bacterium]
MSDGKLNLLAYLILFTPLGAAALVALGALARVPRRAFDVVTIGLSSVSLAASLLLVAALAEQPSFTASIWIVSFYLDALSVYFLVLVNLVAFFAACYVPSFLQHESHTQSGERAAYFHFFFNLFHFSMVLVPMVDNLVLLWMAVELTTLVSTLLVRFRGDRRALEAGWKYLVITTTGIIFALLGTVLLAAATPEDIQKRPGDLMSWHNLQAIAGRLDADLIQLAFLFALVGYGTKAGFAPMHTWLPDGHGEAPSPVSALLSGVLLKSALFAILRFYTLTNLSPCNNQLTSGFLLMVGLFSLATATPFILKRNRFKRLLAYHSLEHMGIIAFGLGIGGPIGVFGALLHSFNHALTKALMFLAYGHTRTLYAQHRAPIAEHGDDEPLRGVLKAAPLHGGLLAMGGLALVGSPPFNIFQSEFLIVWAAVERATEPLVVFAVAAFLILVTAIFGGLVVHLARLLLGPAPFHLERESVRPLLPLMILLAIIIIFGFVIPATPLDFPGLIRRSTDLVIQSAPCPP